MLFFAYSYGKDQDKALEEKKREILENQAIYRGASPTLHIKAYLRVLGSTTAYVEKYYKAFCGSRGNFVKSDNVSWGLKTTYLKI